VSGSEAGPALARAVSIFEDIDARAGARLARRLAQRLGVAEQLPKARRGPYASARAHPLGLTQRELEVLELIAHGLGNKEIARRLHRSPRTIEHQVSAVLDKLNAANRMEVVLRLRSEPWLLSVPAAPAATELRYSIREIWVFTPTRSVRAPGTTVMLQQQVPTMAQVQRTISQCNRT
jgi:DNA-binding CsgD family transcriptional regulator